MSEPSPGRAAHPAPVVAIIGPVGAGKSVVLRFLEEFGAAVINLDDYSRELLRPGRPETEAVQRALGERFVRADGTVDRAALGALIFRDDEARRSLEAIVHPPMLERLREDLAAFRRHPTAPLLAVEGAILGQLAPGWFDRTILVTAEPGERTWRLTDRKGMDVSTALHLVSLHAVLGLNDEPADFVIDTTGEPLLLVRDQVAEIWRELTGQAPGGNHQLS